MNPKVFISYSWDNPTHEDWVISFTNELRKKGIDATIDKFETQKGTVNLNRMMVDKINNYDFVIVVITEKYTDRSDSFTGGVGYESELLLSKLQNTPNKVIPILRQKGNQISSIPFFLQGYHYIDFSNDNNFDIKLDELLHRLYKVNLIDEANLGEIPTLSTRKTNNLTQQQKEIDLTLIPDLKKITKIDIDNFITDKYTELIDLIDKYSKATMNNNNNFTYNFNKINSSKCTFEFFLNGEKVKSIKFWTSQGIGYKNRNIFVSLDWYSLTNDNSYNSMIGHEIIDNKIYLNAFYGLHTFNKLDDIKKIASAIWNDIAESLKMYR